MVVLDPTVASIVNIDVLPYCDVLVTSLTKYAARYADVMAGLLVVNPHARDAARLAYELDGLQAFVGAVNANASRLAAYLEGHPRIVRVRHPRAQCSRERFASLLRPGGGPGIDNDIDPDLIRVSVGIEPIDALLVVFDEALGPAAGRADQSSDVSLF